MSARRMMLTMIAAVALACALPEAAISHDTSYSDARLEWRSSSLTFALRVHRDDAAAVLGRADGAVLLDPREGAAPRAALATALARRVTLRIDGRDVRLEQPEVELLPESRSLRFTWHCALAQRAGRIALEEHLLAPDAQHEMFVSLRAPDGSLRQQVLSATTPAAEWYARDAAGQWAAVRAFVPAGVHHIFIGPDHILFIVGLLLLGGGLLRVLKVATAFTLAHSITLALAATGVLAIPSRIVEPAIAASIVYIGIENLRAREGAPDPRTRLAFLFGLIHGLGFASVLRDVGLPREALAVSLASFNVGVEIGQAAIVLAVTPLLGQLRAVRPLVAARTVRFASFAIIAMGGYWFVQRLLSGA